MRRSASYLLATILAAAQAAACGGSPSLGEAPPCPTVTPLPTSAATPRINQGAAYNVALQQRMNQLQDLFTGFKLAHPNHNFNRDSAFRPAVAKFIDDSTCVATALRQMEAPSAQQDRTKKQIDAALDAYLAQLSRGREAVRSRNATDYHTFWDGLDARFDDVRASFSRR